MDYQGADRQRFCFLVARCPICDRGQLRFWRCPSGELLVICDACSVFFRSPELLGIEDAIIAPQSPGWWSAELGFAVAGLGSGWAQRAEVQAGGWGAHIAGEADSD